MLLLKPPGLAVPDPVPQNIVDASTHFTAWLMRKHADPTGAEAFWVEKTKQKEQSKATGIR